MTDLCTGTTEAPPDLPDDTGFEPPPGTYCVTIIPARRPHYGFDWYLTTGIIETELVKTGNAFTYQACTHQAGNAIQQHIKETRGE